MIDVDKSVLTFASNFSQNYQFTAIKLPVYLKLR